MRSELEELLSRQGPLTFDRYMELALYHPAFGYYSSRVPGRGVTYATSASIGPRFGELVSRELIAMWEALGRPDPFVVTEFGAGYAGLAGAAIRAAGPLKDALRWRIVEQFEEVAQLQRRCLGPAARCVEWITWPGGEPVEGCVLANEVLDNFPFHRFEMTAEGIREIYVAWDGGRIREVTGPVSSPELLAPVRPVESQMNQGYRFEVVPGMRAWCRQVGHSLKRGYLLVIDYGDEEPDIWLRGASGTLSTYSDRGRRADALEDPGYQDITAEVDFTALNREAQAAGFDFELLALQSYWLASLGAAGEADQLEAESKIAHAFGMPAEAQVLRSERDQLLRLMDAKGLGGCLVYRASKGV